MSTVGLSDDRDRIDVPRVLGWLRATYWGGAMEQATLERAIAHSLCVGAYRDGVQVGFARAVTDRATTAWLADVIVDEAVRGEGVGKAMVGFLIDHPELAGLRRWGLNTRDAHAVYKPFGFVPVERPEDHMERLDPGYRAGLVA